MKQTITRDDLTHEVIPDDDAIVIDLIVGNREGKFEATRASHDAIAALLFDRDPSKVMALIGTRAGASAPAKPANTAKAAGRKGGGPHASARAWCETPPGQAAAKRLGIPPTAKGRMPKALVDAWRDSLSA